MKTYPFYSLVSGVKSAFEVENILISPRQAAVLLGKVSGVSNVRCRRLFGPDPEIHVTFDYMSLEYVVWEPYGDSSRFWIGPLAEEVEGIDISPIEKVFQEHSPSFVRRLMGYVFLVGFKSVCTKKEGEAGRR